MASSARGGWSDERVEQTVGRLLQVGVLLAAAVVLLGGIVFLLRHGPEPADHHQFLGEPSDLRSPTGIVEGTLQGSSRALIQLGVLLLIATPVARVVFSVYAFLRQRDLFYVVVTLIVLVILLASLFSRRLGLHG